MLLLTLLAGAASALVAPVVPRPRSARAAAAVELADCPPSVYILFSLLYL